MTQCNPMIRKLLLVDDDAFILKTGVHALRSAGYQDVLTAENGSSALDCVGSTDGLDIIICDLNMPEMDGIELLRHLASCRYAGGIILASAEDARILRTAMDLARHHRLHVLGSVEKPFKAEALRTMLDTYQGAPSPQRATPVDDIGAEELRHGLAVRELQPHFQPKVDIATRQLVGAEALVRWSRPGRGLAYPDQFIPLAEDSGLIDLLTDCMLDMAMQQAALWRTQGLYLKVAVNVSMNNLHNLDLPELIVARASHAGLPLDSLILEVTESRLMADRMSVLDILTRLRLKRIGLSIDDFGTGYSSLEQLQAIPFNELKVDRRFVQGATRDPAARSIFESSVALAKKLGMTVVAEGVETAEDWQLTQQLGCDMAQGYFIGRPMAADAFNAWIHAWETQKSTF